MKKIIFFSFIFFCLASCGKNKEVKIIAKNAATGAPYAGLEYLVVSSRTAANGEKYKTEASGTLNSNGEAMVSIKKKSGRSYSIQVKAPENSCYTNQSPQFFDSPYDVNGTFVFEFAECSYLQLRVKNINCQNSNDRIVFDMQPTYISDYTNISPTEKWGCYDNEFIDSQVPFGTWSASWEVTKNNVTTLHDTLFTIAPNEHYYLYLKY